MWDDKSQGVSIVTCGCCGKEYERRTYKLKYSKAYACSPECLNVVSKRRAAEEVVKKTGIHPDERKLRSIMDTEDLAKSKW